MTGTLSERVAARLGTQASAGSAAQPPARKAAAPAVPAPPARASRLARPRQPAVAGLVEGRGAPELMLMPGQLYFGGDVGSVRTLLGSCVAMTLWHPGRRIGGMCHYLLPERRRDPAAPLDGRYGDEAVLALVGQLERHGCRSSEFVAHLYGGADTMTETAGVKFNVGERNIECGWKLIEAFHFTLDGVDVGDNMPRTVTLTLATGGVDCRRSAPG